jgi:hypothetical protein
MSLSEHIAEQLSQEGIEVSSEQIQTYIDSYEAPKPKAKAVAKKVAPAPKAKVAKKAKTVEETKPKAKVAPKSKAKKVSSEEDEAAEVHYCEHTIRGKDGTTRLCEAVAKNEVDGSWRCGTESSGHYKSALAAAAKAAAKTKTAKGVPKTAAKSKATDILKKTVFKKNVLNIQQVDGVWIDLESRIAFEEDTRVPYGILDEDNETILPLTDESARYLEAHNHPVPVITKKAAKVVPKAKTGKVAPKVVTKVAPKAKVASKTKAKVVSKAKAKKVVEEELVEELQQGVEDADVGEDIEPEAEEGVEGVVEEDAEAEIDLGGDGETEPQAEEDQEEGGDDGPDVEEVDEGEAVDVDDDEGDGEDEE